MDVSPEILRLFEQLELLAFDIDGTLTDGTTWSLGEGRGWTQRYSVRDGEALLRLQATGLPLVPVSRNKTLFAQERMRALGLPTRWVGVDDKRVALREVVDHYEVHPEHICFVGDGKDDVDIFRFVGIGCAVADAHPDALSAARHITHARGGHHVVEEIEALLPNRSPGSIRVVSRS